MFRSCNRAVTATATTQAPETSEGCPGGIRQDDEYPEVIHNPDIRVEGVSMREEKEPEERGEREPEKREDSEPEEEGDAEPEDEEENPEKQRSTDLTTETPTETNERHGRTRHVPGGVWLAQVRLGLYVKFLPVWNRSGSERGSQARDREEGVVGKII
ncbi:hypothetical protein NDU88_004096 [Pleurodeles waltl]|uniref:Uncharacterized protein n=1 Tax=Pleurodeles waltl TaxID=8319 RepID=A0AAV7W402_PLEWA|nr:hypothetical protein NDU88_004096 [Pleurodeles waltl]